MSIALAPLARSTRPGPRQRRAEKRRLKRIDALSARLAELHAIRDLLEQAVQVVSSGWVQGAWFSVETPGGTRPVTAYDLYLVDEQPVVGACLVGAVVHAAGGPATVRSQLVQRTLDLTWHALREDTRQPVRLVAAPRVRMMTVLELTHWNDSPDRTQGEVVGLLQSAGQAAAAHQELCRSEQESLTPVH